MAIFCVNVVVHGDVEVEAESEDEATNLASDVKLEGYNSNTYHVDTHDVVHPNPCNCIDCREEDKDDNV